MECPTKLSEFGENPPPDTAENELQTASNASIPFPINNRIASIVIPKYTFHKDDAVFLILGVNLSSVGPGASAKNNCLPAIAN